MIVVVPRLVAGLLGGEQVPPIGPASGATPGCRAGALACRPLPIPFHRRGRVGNRGELALAEVFADFPVALLERIDDAS